MSKIKEKEKAQKLRRNGSSIGEISRELHVSKSTVSIWCRDISLSKEAMRRIAAKGKEKSIMGLMKYSESVRKNRLRETELSMKRGADDLGELTKRDVYCLGLGLYWGEGYKRGSQEFGFTNSDPSMIQFYIYWLKTVFGVRRSDLILRVSINISHKKRVNEVEAFWVQKTGVSLDQFSKTSFIKTQSKKVYENSESHFGTLRVKVRKGTRMRREVLGALKSISKNAY